MKKNPVTINENSTYHTIMVRKYGRAGAVAILQQQDDMQRLFDTVTQRAVKAYNKNKNYRSHWT